MCCGSKNVSFIRFAKRGQHCIRNSHLFKSDNSLIFILLNFYVEQALCTVGVKYAKALTRSFRCTRLGRQKISRAGPRLSKYDFICKTGITNEPSAE